LNFNGAGALKTRLIALLAILAASPALAIDHWAETAHILTGVEILSVDDDAILVSKESQPQVEACGLIFVSESGQVRVEAEDKDRQQIEVTQRTTSEDEPRQWIIHATGRVWVRIELIDFAAQKWDVEKFDYLIEGTRPPDPDDDDDDDLTIPEDDFDNIGRRVAGWSAGLPDGSQLAACYTRAAVKLREDPTQTINQVSATLVEELLALPVIDQYAAVRININADLQQRWSITPMARGVLADYFDAIAAGFGGTQ
jgi:hypothetical protein